MSGKKARHNGESKAERDRVELVLRRQLDQLYTLGMSDEHGERIRSGVVLLLQPKGPEEKVRDLAEERRLEIEAFYKSLGFTIVVPKLVSSNAQLNDWRKAGKEPEYRPSDAEVLYDAFMTAVGQPGDWTVAEYKAGETSTIGWEPCAEGYWFWADVEPACPRTGTSWNDLTKTVRLPSLEEYVIVWWERKSRGIILDGSTWCWLRTRFGLSGALGADERGGVVCVHGDGADGLAGSFGDVGGRATEMVKKPAA